MSRGLGLRTVIAGALAAWALAACDPAAPPTPPGPAAPVEAAPNGAEGGPAAKTERFAAKGVEADRWTAENIDQLAIQAPTRVGRTPVPLPTTEPRYAGTAARLEAFVTQWGREPGDPWAIGHAMLALGPEMKLTNDEPAVPWLLRTFAVEYRTGGKALLRFPKSVGKVRVEPHTALMLKIFAELGVDPDLSVEVQGAKHPVSDLYRGVLIGASLEPQRNRSSFDSPNDMPWALQALATWAPLRPPAEGGPPDLRWVAGDGAKMSLRDFTVFNTSVLIAESQALFTMMETGAAFEKKGQGVLKYTCGGAHLLQGVAYATARGLNTPLGEKALAAQVELAFWRLPRELALYDQLSKAHPEHADLLLVQRLKFTGHFVETTHKMAAMGLFSPTEAQRAMMVGAADQIVLTVEALRGRGVLDRMPALRKENEQMALDLIGDSAHAARGLRLALGEGVIAY